MLFSPTVAASEQTSLPDLPLFAEKRLGQWVGAGNGMSIEREFDENDASMLPIDQEQTYEGLPSYRVNTWGDFGWWSVSLAGKNWEPYSLEPYIANGYLEFNIKSSGSPVDVQIGIGDINFDREERENVPNRVPLSNYVRANQTWQAVRIPLRDLLVGEDDFQLRQVSTLQFSGGKAQLFWLNQIRFTSADPEPTYPIIKVNQLGYLPDAQKVARISGFDGRFAVRDGDVFEVRSTADDTVAYHGNLTLVSEFDAVSGERVLQAEFSDLSAEGVYYIAIVGAENSPPFEIASTLYDSLLTDSLRYFFLQRVGINLETEYAGQFARLGGHQQDSTATLRSQTQRVQDVSGGWYDAGDYGKYTNAGATAVSDLLWMYELFGDQFADNQLNIIESGNGVPDILDEVRWELEWVLKMQDEATGGFFHAIQDTDDAPPAQATTPRTIEDVYWGRKKDPTDDRYHVIPTATTGSAVAALAHGATVFAEVDTAFAEVLLESAEKGWQYLVSQPTAVESIGGPYSDDDDHDDRFWAAAELYRATGDPRYHDYVRFVHQDVKTLFDSETDNAYGVGTVGMLGWLAYMHSDTIDEQMQLFFEREFGRWATMMQTRHAESAWSLTLLDEDFYWGSNYVMLTTPLVLAVGEAALGEITDTTRQMSQDALNYLLGTNPLRFSFISGYGEDSVQNLFSMIWRHDELDEEPAGVLAGGANEYTNPMLPSNYPAKQYIDSAGSWSLNEHTVYWNAALAFNIALATDDGTCDDCNDSTNGFRVYLNPMYAVVVASSSLVAVVLGVKAAQHLAGE